MKYKKFTEFLQNIEWDIKTIPIGKNNPHFGYYDALALMSAIIIPARNKSDILLSRFALALLHLEYKTIDGRWLSVRDNIKEECKNITLATFFIHGGRILLQSKTSEPNNSLTSEPNNSLYDLIKKSTPVASRALSSHDLERVNGEWKETKITMPSLRFWGPAKNADKHEAINFAAYGEGNFNPLTGKKAASDGGNGHLLLLNKIKKENGLFEECTAFSIETAESLHGNAYGGFHGPNCSKSAISVSGTSKEKDSKTFFDNLLKVSITDELTKFRINLDEDETAEYFNMINRWFTETIKKMVITYLFFDAAFYRKLDMNYAALENSIKAALGSDPAAAMKITPKELFYFRRQSQESNQANNKPKFFSVNNDVPIFSDMGDIVVSAALNKNLFDTYESRVNLLGHLSMDAYRNKPSFYNNCEKINFEYRPDPALTNEEQKRVLYNFLSTNITNDQLLQNFIEATQEQLWLGTAVTLLPNYDDNTYCDDTGTVIVRKISINIDSIIVVNTYLSYMLKHSIEPGKVVCYFKSNFPDKPLITEILTLDANKPPINKSACFKIAKIIVHDRAIQQYLHENYSIPLPGGSCQPSPYAANPVNFGALFGRR
jgi:hypothetical protein